MKENTENNVKRFIRVPDVLNRVGSVALPYMSVLRKGTFLTG